MELLATLFVGQPASILVVALILFGVFLVQRSRRFFPGRKSWPTLVSAVAWGLYAAWEWLVQVKTPEANIRVDLLLIWPVLAILTLWSIIRLVWSK